MMDELITLDPNLLRYIPKRKRAAVRDIFHDSDGYWIFLAPGWKVYQYAAEGVIHEDTIKELLEVFKRVR